MSDSVNKPLAPPTYNRGSFRDPAGQIWHWNDRVFRLLSSEGLERFEALQKGGALRELVDCAGLWPTIRVADDDLPAELKPLLGEARPAMLEHPKIPFISYPYEWSFSSLKRAALLHLDLHIKALDKGFSLLDGTAYNIQFVGSKPVFIDTLSLIPYEAGDYWQGYRQFCEQFLNPLLLTSKLGVSHHSFYRGALEGILIEDMERMLPFRSKMGWGVLVHVALHAKLTRKVRNVDVSARVPRRKMSKTGLRGLLTGLRSLIEKQQPKGLSKTDWGDYEHDNSYEEAEAIAKRRLISEFAETMRPDILWDLGCNSGEHSEQALLAGAGKSIGFDFDAAALEAAVRRADEKQLDFLPLMLDATNPSPSQGWQQSERMGLQERTNADAVLALAFLHHLVIGKNIPLPDALDWITGFAPAGIIEFVPKSDPMVQGMLSSRRDIFPDYDIENFRAALLERAAITNEQTVSATGRVLFTYQKAVK